MKIKTLRLALMAASLLLAPLATRADLIWTENFPYVNGSLTNVSSGIWVKTSGSASPSDMIVSNNFLEVAATSGSGANAENRQDDCYRKITNSSPNNSTYTNASTVLYASFTFICTNLPGPSNYFATFNSTVSGFYGRIYGQTNGALQSNTFRVGMVGGNSTTPTVYPFDLATNVMYQVVVAEDMTAANANYQGTIYVNPVGSGDYSVLTRDTATPPASPINSFLFRQASTAGNSFYKIKTLTVATSFDEAATNALSTNAVAPIIVRSPIGVTNFTGATYSMVTLAAGQGLGSLTYTWLKNGVPVTNPNGNTNLFLVSSAATSDTGAYSVAVTTPFGLSVTSAVTQVKITDNPVPPIFTSQPVKLTVYRGQTAVFSGTTIGPGTTTYQWQSNNVDIPGETGNTLTLVGTTTNFAANYRLTATNDYGGVVSTNAALTVLNPPVVTVSYLRHLVDPGSYQTTNTSLPYEVIGTITTFTNITTGNTASYYLQDATGGINIFATGGSTFRPQLGDVVDYVGVMSSFTSGVELYADTNSGAFNQTAYSIISNNYPLPAPLVVPFSITNSLSNMVYNIAGLRVQLTNVYFGTNAGLVISTTANTNISVTNVAGQKFSLFFSFQDLDTAGQTLPAFASSVTGVMYGLTNFSVAVTKWSDINTTVVVNPIPLTITNTQDGKVVVSWSDPSFSLLSSPTAGGPYLPVSGATSPYTNTVSANGVTFYRLIH